MKKTPTDIDRHVGSRVRLQRLVAGISQEKLGEALGVTFQQVQKYEKGTNRIGAGRLEHIAQVLKVPVTFFYGGRPQQGGELQGFAEEEAHDLVTDFVTSSEGVQLIKAFARIRHAGVRRRIISLVEILADNMPGEAEEPNAA